MKSIAVIAVLLLAGCATQNKPVAPTVAKINYFSEPTGAAIYEGDKLLGYAPVTASYAITEDQRKIGYKMIRPTRAVWSSGAAAQLMGNPKFDFAKGYLQEAKFIRPAQAPGLADDLRVAENMERLRQIQLQTARQNAEAVAQAKRDQAQADQQVGANDNAGLNLLFTAVAVGLGAAAQNRSAPLPPPSLPPLGQQEKQKFRCQNAGFGNVECKEY
jgi:hypothetical protein